MGHRPLFFLLFFSFFRVSQLRFPERFKGLTRTNQRLGNYRLPIRNQSFEAHLRVSLITFPSFPFKATQRFLLLIFLRFCSFSVAQSFAAHSGAQFQRQLEPVGRQSGGRRRRTQRRLGAPRRGRPRRVPRLLPARPHKSDSYLLRSQSIPTVPT